MLSKPAAESSPAGERASINIDCEQVASSRCGYSARFRRCSAGAAGSS